MKIKVCGMRNPGNLEQVCALRPDFVGFIFYSGSKRFVGDSPDRALFRIPSPEIQKVGVFVNESMSTVKKAFNRFALHLVQLHGNESPDYCSRLSQEGIPVIKALDARADLALMEAYREHVKYFLFDTPDPGYGGTGRKFDWSLLKGIPASLSFLLGGGIGPGDEAGVLNLDHQGMLGVDLNSRFEVTPGFKDVKKLNAFMATLKNR